MLATIHWVRSSNFQHLNTNSIHHTYHWLLRLWIHGGQLNQDSADELSYDVHKACQDIIELIDQKIHCHNRGLGEIIQYVHHQQLH